MHDAAGVQVLQTAEYLIEKDLHVIGGDRLIGDDDLMEIALHKFGYHVDLLEDLNVRRLKHV